MQLKPDENLTIFYVHWGTATQILVWLQQRVHLVKKIENVHSLNSNENNEK